MYILLNEDNTVAEIILEEDSTFPGVPIGKRYSPEFVAQLIKLSDSEPVEQNWIYNPKTGVCSKPKVTVVNQ